jgi:uncharacterized protein (DUF3084 family)
MIEFFQGEKMKNICFLLIALICAMALVTISGCGVSKNEYEQAQKEISSLKEKLNLSQSEKDALKAEYDKILSEKVALKSTYDSILNEKLALKGEYDKLLQEKIQLNIQTGNLTTQINKLREEIEKYKQPKKK